MSVRPYCVKVGRSQQIYRFLSQNFSASYFLNILWEQKNLASIFLKAGITQH